HRGARSGARRIGANRCSTPAVAQVIEINSAPSGFFGHVRRELSRALRDETIRNPLCEGLDLVPTKLGCHRDDHMQAFAPGRLGKALEADLKKSLSHTDSGFGHARPWRSLIGVEIEGDPVGGFELFDPRAP